MRTVNEEFDLIEQQLGKVIEVTWMPNGDSPDFPKGKNITTGKLDYFFPYNKVVLSNNHSQSSSGECKSWSNTSILFIGIEEGIFFIKDDSGRLLYENPNLKFKELEEPSARLAQINQLRQKKFGIGHEWKMEEVEYYLK